MKKKVLAMVACGILVLSLTGCGDKVETVKCNQTEQGIDMDIEMTATNDEINKIKMTAVYDSESFGLESLSSLTDEEKQTVKDTMLSTLGIDENTEGLSIDIDFGKDMTITFDIDLTTADQEVLDKVGLDFSDADMSLKNTIEKAEKDGATCKKQD